MLLFYDFLSSRSEWSGHDEILGVEDSDQTALGIRDVLHVYRTTGQHRIKCILQVFIMRLVALGFVTELVVDWTTEKHFLGLGINDEDFGRALHTQRLGQRPHLSELESRYQTRWLHD